MSEHRHNYAPTYAKYVDPSRRRYERRGPKLLVDPAPILARRHWSHEGLLEARHIDNDIYRFRSSHNLSDLDAGGIPMRPPFKPMGGMGWLWALIDGCAHRISHNSFEGHPCEPVRLDRAQLHP